MGRVWTLRPIVSTGRGPIRPVTTKRRSAKMFAVKGHPSEQRFKAEFKARLKRMRKAIAMSQSEMAAALGLEGDPETRRNTYAKWEQLSSKNNFPAYLLPRLAEITGHDLWFILTEQSETYRPKRRKIS